MKDSVHHCFLIIEAIMNRVKEVSVMTSKGRLKMENTGSIVP